MPLIISMAIMFLSTPGFCQKLPFVEHSTLGYNLSTAETPVNFSSAPNAEHSPPPVCADNARCITEAKDRTCDPTSLTVEEVRKLVVNAARRYGVDEKFAVAIAWAESRLDRVRNSEKGARGPMQLMPATAARFGVKDICNPYENIEGGIKYLKKLTEKFHNPVLVAAAYNAGEVKIEQNNGVPPYQETLNYISKVLNYQLGIIDNGNEENKKMHRSEKISGDKIPGIIFPVPNGGFLGSVMQF